MYMCIMLCQVGHIINNNGENAAKLAKEKKDMAVILNNPLSKLIISRGNHHTFLRHALNNPKCQGRCA